MAKLGILAITITLPLISAHADTPSTSITPEEPSASDTIGSYSQNWFDRVSDTQAEQPHWITPLATVTPRLEQELRYDQSTESPANGNTLNSYGGGKGLELIPSEKTEFIIGFPAWQSESTYPQKNGWADQTFLVKYRIISENEKKGNYILTAFMGMSVPNGSNDYSSHHYSFTPTIAFGKGWGNFDFQSTLSVTIPDNGSASTGTGTPIQANTAFQYKISKIVWPEIELNYTLWPNGEHGTLNQLFLTPGLIIGRIPLWNRLGLTTGVGYQVSVTNHPLVRNNLIFTIRLPF